MEITISINTVELRNIRIALNSRINKIQDVLIAYEDEEYIKECYQKEYNAMLSILLKLDEQENKFFQN
jgi:hypothetical protein